LNGVLINTVAETQDTSVLKLMAIEGAGFVALPDLAADQHVQDGKLIKIASLLNVFEEIWLVSAERKINNPVAAKLFKDFRLA
jgi:LysR family transcriptional activator of nhaA